MKWFVIVQHYSDATDLFNMVDIVGPFDTQELADAFTARQTFSTYVKYTITTPSDPY